MWSVRRIASSVDGAVCGSASSEQALWKCRGLPFNSDEESIQREVGKCELGPGYKGGFERGE